MTEHETQERLDGEVGCMQRIVDELEMMDDKARERVVTYLFDRFAPTKTPWP
jgi:hypothetical protein